MNSRLKKLVSNFSAHSIDALLVTKDVNLTYLTHFPAAESWLLVSLKRSIYLTDARYVLEAKKRLKGIAVHCYTTSMLEDFFALAKDLGLKRIGFDPNHLTVAQFELIQKKCPDGISLVKANHLVEHLREVKDAEELALMKGALAMHQEALRFIKPKIRPGATEKDIDFSLKKWVLERQVGFSFNSIIASGPNSCLPHAKPTGRVIKNNENVLLDMGIDLKGYKSDLTRNFFLGKIPPLIYDVKSYVTESQHLAIAKIKPGVMVADVDREARNYLKKNKLDQYFGHSLGHGVGLEIHESPRLSQKSKEVLREGMVVTVEPAVYIPNKFGIRVEDMILVTKKGSEVLSVNIH